MAKNSYTLWRLLLLLVLFQACTKDDDNQPTPSNLPPVIEAPFSATATADSLFTLQLSVSDPDGPVPEVSFEGLPDWLSYEASSQVLSGTPSRADEGSTSFDIVADDGLDLRRKTVALSVAIRYTLREKLEREVTQRFMFSTTGMTGVSVAVLTPEGELMTTARGNHNAWAGEPLDANYRYRAASVSKTFTAALILRLAEEGLLDLDDALFDHLPIPGLPNGPQITIRQLLHHGSGLPDHLNDGGFYTGDWMSRVWVPQDIYDYAIDKGAYFEPGTGYRYSNTGFYILGELAAAVTGLPLSDAFEQWVLAPLGLEQTLFDDFSTNINRIDSLAQNDRAYEYHLTSVGAAGAMVATPADMARFGQAVFGGGFLSAASKTAMATDYGFALGGDHYGLGTRLWDDNGVVHYGHTGALMDYRSIIMYVPESNVTIALSTNNPHPNWFDLVNGVLVVVANHYR